jgi:hypothetical protein
MTMPISMLRSCAGSVKFADPIYVRSLSTTTRFACRLARGASPSLRLRGS